jgi:hypothetical protein
VLAISSTLRVPRRMQNVSFRKRVLHHLRKRLNGRLGGLRGSHPGDRIGRNRSITLR